MYDIYNIIYNIYIYIYIYTRVSSCKMHERGTQHKNANADNSKETLPIRIPQKNTTPQNHTRTAFTFLP